MEYQRILLIDDDEDDQEIFKSAIEQISKTVDCRALSSAREALRQLQVNDIQPDVIFLDLNMPIMNGIDFLREIKRSEQLRSIPVIIFSTSSNPATVAETKELGAINFITKPNKISLLVEVLNNVLN